MRISDWSSDVCSSDLPTKPPTFLWSKTNADIAELGQTWSQPKLALVKGHTDLSGNPIPVIIMVGGYDTPEDTDPVATPDRSEERRVGQQWFSNCRSRRSL